VRVACSRCTRKGSYRLARLAAKLGPETQITDVLKVLSRDCEFSGFKRFKGHYETCGAMLSDLGTPKPPDLPPAVAMRPRIVGGRG